MYRVVAEEIHSTEGQVSHLLTVLQNEKKKTIVCTLTKRMAEDLAEYLRESGVEVRYLHSEISSKYRREIVQEFSSGKVQVLVAVGMVREMKMAPVVAILDADASSSLRSHKVLVKLRRRATERVIVYATCFTPKVMSAFPILARKQKVLGKMVRKFMQERDAIRAQMPKLTSGLQSEIRSTKQAVRR